MLKFNNGTEMYNYLLKGSDLYSKSLGIYVFEYNDAHTLCYYHLNPYGVMEILKRKKETGEYWGAYLGIGGSILDDPDYNDDYHRYHEDEAVRALYLKPSLDFCEKLFMTEDWMDTDDVNEAYIEQLARDFLNDYINKNNIEDICMLFDKTLLVECTSELDWEWAVKDELVNNRCSEEQAVCKTEEWLMSMTHKELFYERLPKNVQTDLIMSKAEDLGFF